MEPFDPADAPEPVQRYLNLALGGRDTPIARARFSQHGELRTDVRSARWLAFTARHNVDALEIGFEWNARVRMLPLLPVAVRDAYRCGVGSAGVRLLSVVPVASQADDAQLNAAALQRFLAEAAWYPTALAPSHKLHWAANDERSAVATLTDHGGVASIEFRFDAAGDVTGVYTPARARKTSSGYQMNAWEGHFFDHAQREGLRIPMRAEVGWYVDGAWICVWRGELLSAQYEFAE